MASGHRKRKAAILRAQVLNPSSLTNIADENRGDPAEQNSLMNNALYSMGGLSYVIPPAAVITNDIWPDNINTWTRLGETLTGPGYTNAIWPLLGYAGETTANSSGFLPSNVNHFWVPAAPGFEELGASGLTGSSIFYSDTGPRSNLNPYYENVGYILGYGEGSFRTSGTASINLGTTISGAASGKTKLLVYVAGLLPSGSKLTVTTGTATPLISYTSSSADASFYFNSKGEADFDSLTASFSTRFPTAISGNLPGAGDKIAITLPVGYAGLTATSSYTIQIITGSLVTPPANTMYIVTGSGGINLTGSTFHGILKSGINAATASNTSSLGTGFSDLYNYVSASSAAAGITLYARQPSRFGYQIAVSGSNNKIKKAAGISYFQYEPFFVSASFNTASMGSVILTYSASAASAVANTFTPGFVIYITGSN